MKNLFSIALLFFTLQLSAQQSSIPKWSLADLKKAVDSAEGPTIINFWATFCKPCVEEIPYFQSLAAKYKEKGVKLILVNLDAKEVYGPKLQSFIKKLGITVPVRFLTETNADLFCPAVDSSWSGAIPASVFINPQTGYRAFFEDQLTPAQLEKQIVEMLGEKSTEYLVLSTFYFLSTSIISARSAIAWSSFFVMEKRSAVYAASPFLWISGKRKILFVS